MKFVIRSKVWSYAGPGGWHFVTLPASRAQQVKGMLANKRTAWGSVPVRATIGNTSWRTSVFPDRKSKSYVLPIKANVRREEGIVEGDRVRVDLEFTT